MDGISRAFSGIDALTLLSLVILSGLSIPIVLWIIFGGKGREPSAPAVIMNVCVMLVSLGALVDLMSLLMDGKHIEPVQDLLSGLQSGSATAHVDVSPTLLVRLGILLGLALFALGLYQWFRLKSYLGTKVEMISSACFDIVKMVENASNSGWKNAVRADADITARFAVEGTSQIIGASQLLVSRDGLNPTETLLKPGEDMRNYQQMRRSNWLTSRRHIRSGVSILIQVLSKGNFSSAYLDLVNYMRDQISDEKKTMPNFPHLKAFFDIPSEWPNEQIIKEAEKRDFTNWDYKRINLILWWGKSDIRDALHFQPPAPEGKPEIDMFGKQTLRALRKFLHAGVDDLYEEK